MTDGHRAKRGTRTDGREALKCSSGLKRHIEQEISLTKNVKKFIFESYSIPSFGRMFTHGQGSLVWGIYTLLVITPCLDLRDENGKIAQITNIFSDIFVTS